MVKQSKNNQIVFDALAEAGRPMGAYELIDAVRPAGIAAPPTVYRALTKLIEQGAVHRIESRNAFVACNGCHNDGEAIVLVLCNECGQAEEFTDPEIGGIIKKQAAYRKFVVHSTVLEVQGLCAACQA
jgi:Fur family transcriptional regulator, zinc uptake regulator